MTRPIRPDSPADPTNPKSSTYWRRAIFDWPINGHIMVVILKKRLRKGQLDAALARFAKAQRKGASILRFVGKIPFEGDPTEVQKAMRRERR